jgi:hypothetical protein
MLPPSAIDSSVAQLESVVRAAAAAAAAVTGSRDSNRPSESQRPQTIKESGPNGGATTPVDIATRRITMRRMERRFSARVDHDISAKKGNADTLPKTKGAQTQPTSSRIGLSPQDKAALGALFRYNTVLAPLHPATPAVPPPPPPPSPAAVAAAAAAAAAEDRKLRTAVGAVWAAERAVLHQLAAARARGRDGVRAADLQQAASRGANAIQVHPESTIVCEKAGAGGRPAARRRQLESNRSAADVV